MISVYDTYLPFLSKIANKSFQDQQQRTIKQSSGFLGELGKRL